MNDPEIFRPHIDSIFLAQPDADSVELRLVDVADERVSRGMQQFSLFFHGPADRVLAQGLYAFRHPALGSLEIFIVPIVGSNNERILYQACFSHPAE